MVKKVLTSIWFLAIFIAIPVFIFFPPIFDKYNCKIISEGHKLVGSNPAVYFEDLDSDGKIERLECFSQPLSGDIFSFQYFNENGGMIEQINFPVKYNSELRQLYFADADNDGNKEIYLFSFEGDSLVLNWVQVTPEISPFYSVPICEINYYNKNLLDYSIGNIFCVDLENDGRKELIFSIIGGYSYSPRQIFKVDIINKTVEHSRNTGSACGNLSFYDLDNDGKLEIISEGQVAPDRDWFNLPYNEPAPYLKVFRSDLSFFFPPVKFFEGIQSITQTFVSNNGIENELICTFMSSSSECEPFRVYKINLKGEKTDSLVYNNYERMRAKYVFQNDRGNYVTQIKPGEFLEFTLDLEIVKTIKLRDDENINLISQADINMDGIQEYFFANSDAKEIYIVSDNFKWNHTVYFENQVSMSGNDVFRKPYQFYIKTQVDYQIFMFAKNPVYFFRYFILLTVYFLSVLIIYLFQKILESQLKEKYELINQVHELQLKTLRNQLDPHFIYNTFNTIASVIKQGKSNEAYDLFVQLSKMIRSNLEGSNEIYTSLKKELDFVKDYLSIQKIRFKELFDFEIIKDKYLNESVLIPKMLIQIHVENALKHGIRPMLTGGILTIRIKEESSKTIIEIRDNGIGRQKAKELNTDSTGIGLKTIQQIIDLNNSNESRKISQQIIDLKDENQFPCGTKIVLTISG